MIEGIGKIERDMNWENNKEEEEEGGEERKRWKKKEEEWEKERESVHRKWSWLMC